MSTGLYEQVEATTEEAPHRLYLLSLRRTGARGVAAT